MANASFADSMVGDEIIADKSGYLDLNLGARISSCIQGSDKERTCSGRGGIRQEYSRLARRIRVFDIIISLRNK